jgi:hypothetical protein
MPTREEKCRYKPSVVVGFKDPSEGEASKIELKYGDSVGVLVSLGFRFFVLRVVDNEAISQAEGNKSTSPTAKATNGYGNSKKRAPDSILTNSDATVASVKKETDIEPSTKKVRDASDSSSGNKETYSSTSSEEDSEFECLCGKRYTSSDSLKRHQRSCVVTQNDAAQTPYMTGRRVPPPSPSLVAASSTAKSATSAASNSSSASKSATTRWDCICGRVYGCKYTLARHAKLCKEALAAEGEEKSEEEEVEVKPKRKSAPRDTGAEAKADSVATVMSTETNGMIEKSPSLSHTEVCVCGREFSSVANLLRHVRFCDVVQNSKDPMAIGLASLVGRFSHSDGYRQRAYVCPCGVASFCSTDLFYHWKKCTRGLVETESGTTNPENRNCFVCDCGSKWPNLKQLKNHRRFCVPGQPDKLKKNDRRRSISDLSEISADEKAVKKKRDKEVDDTSVSSAQSNKRVADKKVLEWAGVTDVDKFEMLKLRQAYLNHIECAQRKAQQMAAERTAGSATRAKKRQSVKLTSSSKVQSPPGENEDLDEEFEVEMILLHIGTDKDKKNLKFLIRWKGYTAAEDSWLTYRDCRDLKALDDYCRLHPELNL